MPIYNSRSVRKSLLTRLGLERMEERDVPAFYLVTGTTDIVAPAPTLGDGSMGDPFQVASLRSAVALANTSAENDTIILQASSTYQLTSTTDYDLEIADAVDFGTLSIVGAGEATTTIQANYATPAGDGRIFQVLAGANLTLSNVKLTGGNANAGGAILAYGGAAATQLTLTNVTITGNNASAYGGAVAVTTFSGGTAVAAVMTNVTMTSNSAGYGGALAVIGYGGTASATLTNSSVSDNTAIIYGGAVCVLGYGGGGTASATLTNSSVSGNVVDGSGGSGGGIAVLGYGGVTLTNSTVTGNIAAYGGGGGIAAVYGGTLTISNSTISGNEAAGYGGGIAAVYGGALDISNSTISGNEVSGYGGGIVVLFGGGTLSIINSTVSGNSASIGGGVALFFDDSAANALTNTTISGNTATFFGGGLAQLSGGGSTAPLDLVNSTVSGNQAAYGGGLAFYGGGVALNNSTVTNNRGTGGGIAADDADEIDVQNSIVAGNFDADGITPNDLYADGGNPFVINYSLIGVGDSLLQNAPSENNLMGTAANPLDPRLGALANNGGPTQTHALLADSPARNAGDPNFTGLATDQRGQTRVLNGRLDIGALESPTITVGPEALPASTSGSAYTAALTATGASGPFIYAVTAGTLPPGLTLSQTGELTGTPTAAGTYTFTVSVTGADGAGGFREFSLTVAATSPKFVLGAGSNGRIQIAGGDGTTIPAFNGFQGEVRVATADLNGDGVLDVIAGSGAGAPGGHIKVFDGSTGAELRSFFAFDGFAGGVFVGAADLDGDGTDEILAGADAGSNPEVRVYGATNTPRLSFLAYAPTFRGGVRVAGFDVNGDGRDEIITGSGPGAAGDGRVFDATGQLLSVQLVPDVSGGIFVG